MASTPAGNESVNPIPLSELDVFGLEMVKVRVEAPPVKTEVGEKDLPKFGGAITVCEAVA